MSTYFEYLISNDIYNDTEPTVNEKLVSEWNEAREMLAKYRQSGINREVLSQWRAALKARSDALAGAQRMAAQINAAATQASIANTNAVASLQKSMMDNMTKLAAGNTEYMSQRFAPAMAAFEGGTVADGMGELVGMFDKQGLNMNLASPDIGALGQNIAVRFFKKNLSELTPEEAAAQIGDVSTNETARRTLEFFRAAQTAHQAYVNGMRTLQTNYEEAEKAARAGSPLSADAAKRMADSALGTVQAMAGGSATDLRTEMERVAAMDSTYAQLQKEAAELKELAIQPGQEGLRTKIGRAIANPEFQAWAAENGFKIGESTIDPETGEMRYIPGVHDERAILAFRRQAITGKPLGFSSNTGMRVQVTATDPKMREQILRDYDLGDGRYVLAEDGKTVLSPQDYEISLSGSGYTPSGYKTATTADGTLYVQDALDTYVFDDGKFVKMREDEDVPPGLEFTQAVVQDEGGRQRYMTRADLRAEDINPDNILEAEPDDEAAIRASAPFKFVTADQLPAVGEVKIVGYLDKANAKDILKYGEGAFTLNGGQHVFTKGAKIEVLGKKESTFLRDREKLAKKRTDEGPTLLEPAQVRLAEARKPVEVVPPARELELTAIGRQALGDEEVAQERAEMAQRGGVFTTGATVPAGAAAPAPAAPAAAAPAAAPAEAAPAPAAAAPAPAAAAPAPAAAAPAAAPAPAAPTYAYSRSPDGAVYRVDLSDESFTMIQPAPGKLLPREDRRTVSKGDTAEYRALSAQIDAANQPVSIAEGQAIERKLAGAGAGITPKPPKYTVEAGRTGTVISYPEVPKERLELFSALRERIRQARAREEDLAGIADEAVEAEGAAVPAARGPRAGAAARSAVTPPTRAAREATAARAAAAMPSGVRPIARRASVSEPPMPDIENEDFTPPTAAERAATRERAMRELAGGQLRERKPITFDMGPYVSRTGAAQAESREATVLEAEAPAPTLAPAGSKGELTSREERREAQRKMRAFRAAQRAARAGNGG